jgi:hypothetical protein
MKSQREIAVRLYANPKLGNTYAKGMYHTAVFNAAADVKQPNVKYLLDYHTYERWEHSAKTDAQMEVLRETQRMSPGDVLFSWVVQYDPHTKAKQPVFGFSYLNLADNSLGLLVVPDGEEEPVQWVLTAKPCKERSGCKSPTLLATNAQDLGDW